MPRNVYRHIHETAVSDIIDKLSGDALEKVSELILGKPGKSKVPSYSSAMRAASGMVLVFPVACSRAMSAETASMLSKAIERQCVTMMQMLFSAYQISSSSNVKEFLDQFHKNIKIGSRYTVDNFIQTMDYIASTVNEGADIKINRQVLQALKEDMKNLNFYLEDDLDDRSYANYSVSKSGVIREDYDPSDPDDMNGLEPGTLPYYHLAAAKEKSAGAKERLAAAELNRAKAKASEANALKNSIEARISDRKDQRTEYDYILSQTKDRNDVLSNILLDNDIKKANEMVPSTMIVNFYSVSGDTPIKVDGVVIGIKAKLIGIESGDIIDHLLTKNNDKHFMLQLLRATTRETSFFKDFIFAIDNAKIDAMNNSKAGSAHPMWKVLEQRALKSKMRRISKGGNDASAITTLVLSQQGEVEPLLKDYNIDLMNPRVVGPIMEGYNFMGVIIVDELLEVVHIMWDNGEDTWEDLSFNSLERETADKNYKKVINLMTKMR